jgi:tRNA nucleotidyltransferase/poly(A) polymerase
MLSSYLPYLHVLLELEPDLYVAGGAVKDCLLGRPISDVDIVFPPEAAGIAARFAGRTGATRIVLRQDEPDKMMERVVVRQGNESLLFDFTACRGPSIESDLGNRDFTLTAMALPLDAFASGDLSRLVDPFSGCAAIRGKEIRALSDESFRQDPLRLLRAFRLAAELAFTIHGETLEKVTRDGALLGTVSGERVRDEIFRILEVNPCHPCIESMDRVGLLGQVFPEMAAMKGIEQEGYHALDVWYHTMLCLKEMESLLGNPGVEFGDAGTDFRDYLTDALVRGRSRAALLKLAALLHDAGKPDKVSRDVEGQTHFYGHAAAGGAIADAVAERLRLAKAEREFLQLCVVNHMHLVHLTAETSRTRRSVLHFFRKYGEDYRALLLLFAADTRATAGPKMTPERVRLIRDGVEEMLRLYEEDLRPRLQAPPLLTGRDLMGHFGLEEGPIIGELLDRLEEARLEGRLRDREEALEYAAVLLKDRG